MAQQTVGTFDRAVLVKRLGGADVVRQAELHRLGAVGDRAAVDRDDQVGPDLPRRRRSFDHRAARCMRRHSVQAVAQQSALRRSPHEVGEPSARRLEAALCYGNAFDHEGFDRRGEALDRLPAELAQPEQVALIGSVGMSPP